MVVRIPRTVAVQILSKAVYNCPPAALPAHCTLHTTHCTLPQVLMFLDGDLPVEAIQQEMRKAVSERGRGWERGRGRLARGLGAACD